MSEMLFVVNKNDFHHEDRFNGVDYQFPPGQKVMLSAEAAAHMFGLGVPDKTSVMHRKGWAFKYDPDRKTFVEDTDAVTKLKNFVFTRAKLVESPAEETPVGEK
ncbi:MAG: hypothetical protein HRJ53_12525 [Acidobacteria bacterium Pan2503]|uniref:Uncharacterized protein n=1 Tax=Candidatus Acidiferrum panamense TaxID=2741543 RepID=A0A7V8SX15_9BACT|nr:hypothetical protein [Candidatus Acidoferrum panamensis]